MRVGVRIWEYGVKIWELMVKGMTKGTKLAYESVALSYMIKWD